MANKRKGILTSDSEWRKHLRKIGKRFFWKGNGLAEKKMINQETNRTEYQHSLMAIVEFSWIFIFQQDFRLTENTQLPQPSTSCTKNIKLTLLGGHELEARGSKRYKYSIIRHINK